MRITIHTVVTTVRLGDHANKQTTSFLSCVRPIVPVLETKHTFKFTVSAFAYVLYQTLVTTSVVLKWFFAGTYAGATDPKLS